MVRPVRRVPLPALRHGRPTTASRIELRQAIEPWHVLGEEMSARRHRALRRLVGRAAAGQGDRHDRRAATPSPATAARCRCTPTGVPGEFVAGVRFRAWSPPSALHPTIGVQAPLVFDLVDPGRSARSAAAPTTSSHPGRPQLRRRSRSTPTRPRRAASRASGRTATRPGR